MRLPKPLSLDEVRAHIPRIDRISSESNRPLWSVMITTYNNGRYLRDALESVLAQDRGPEEMQIEVVDGGSTQDDPELLVRELGKGRVAFHRLAENRGAAGTFNACIERSRGHWVHILHGDDLVCPDFYDSYTALMLAYPQANMIVGQTIIVDENLCWQALNGPIPPPGGGPLPDLLGRLVTCQRVQFPGVVVRRSAYEQVGGFCVLLRHACDWEMWFRIARSGLVACVGRPYALYRRHGESEMSRQSIMAEDIRETYLVARLNLDTLGRELTVAEASTWWEGLASRAEATACWLDSKGCPVGRFNQAQWAWLLNPTPRRLYVLITAWLNRWRVGMHPGSPRGMDTSQSLS